GKKAKPVIWTTERVEQVLAIHIGWRCGDERSSVVDVHTHGAVGTIRVPGPALDRVTPGAIVNTLILGLDPYADGDVSRHLTKETSAIVQVHLPLEVVGSRRQRSGYGESGIHRLSATYGIVA